MKPKLYKLTDRDTGIVTHVIAEEVSEHIAPQWRELGPDEVIQEGDEVDVGFGWRKPIFTLGKSVESQIRKNTQKLKARTRRPLPPSNVVDPVSGVTVPEGFPAVVIPTGKVGIVRGFGYEASKGDFLVSAKGHQVWDRTNRGSHYSDLFYIELVDAPAGRKAREWDMCVGNDGNLYHPGICFAGAPTIRVREVLDGIGGGE